MNVLVTGRRLHRQPRGRSPDPRGHAVTVIDTLENGHREAVTRRRVRPRVTAAIRAVLDPLLSGAASSGAAFDV